MPTLLERAKSTLQKAAGPSPEREARLNAAADLREVVKSLVMERERIDAIRTREEELSITIARLEKEDVEARQVKAETMVSYAAGAVTEEAVTTASARARDVASKLSDTREVHEAVTGELMRCQSDWPPSKMTTLSGSKERMERVFWNAVFAEVSVTEAPPGVQEWVQRCWGAYRVAGFGGLQGMFMQLFPKEFETREMEALRQDMEQEFLSERAQE